MQNYICIKAAIIQHCKSARIFFLPPTCGIILSSDWRGAALYPPFCFGPESTAAPSHRVTILALLKASGKYSGRKRRRNEKTHLET